MANIIKFSPSERQAVFLTALAQARRDIRLAPRTVIVRSASGTVRVLTIGRPPVDITSLRGPTADDTRR